MIVAVAVAVAALALGRAWFRLLRDTAEPVTVDEAVTSFRTETETETTPEQASAIPDVYPMTWREIE